MATEVGQLTLKVDTSDVDRANKSVSELGAKAATTEKRTKDLGNASDGTNKAVGGMSRKAAMAGVQFEQLSNQIAGGQNALTAFGMQAADLGIVLGAPLLGAIVGVGAAVTSILLPILRDTGKSTNELEASLASVSNLMTTDAATSAKILSGSFMELARSSRDLAELQLRVALVESLNNATDAQKRLNDSTKGLIFVQEDATKRVSQYSLTMRANEARAQRFADQMGISKESALELRSALIDMRKGTEGASDTVIKLVNSLLDSDKAKKKFQDLAGPILTAALNLKLSQEQAEFLKSALADLDGALAAGAEGAEGYAETVAGMIASMEQQLAVLERGELAIMLEDAARRGAEPGQIAEIKRIYERIEAKKAEIQATEDAERAAKREAAAAARAAQAKIDQANRQAQSIAESLMTEEEAIAYSYKRRRQIILDSTAMTEELKRETLSRLDAETKQSLLDANQSYWDRWLEQQSESMMTFDTVAAGALDTFKAATGQAFEQIIFDSKSAGDAVRGFAETMGRSIINALGRMAAEWAAYYLVQSMMGKTAQAGAATAMTANAAATSLQAGISAFASTAAIPIVGPAAAPAAMAAAISATSPFVTAITSLATSAVAARALGGQVRAGESYIVGERGPELLTMGSTGHITTNEALTRSNPVQPTQVGGTTKLNVQVLNYGSSQIEVERISETDVRIIAREVAAQTVREQAPGVIASDMNNPNGRVSRSLSSNVVAQRRR